MMDLLRDLRFALRMLAKAPALTAVMVVALGLGIGISTAVFGAANVILLRPLSARAPEEIARVFMGPSSEPRVWGNLSYAEYADLAQEGDVFSGLVAYAWDSPAFSNGEAHQKGNAEQAESLWSLWVSGNFFEVLGVAPILGRTFTAEEANVSGSQPVIVISDALWRRRFHGEPSVLGRRVYLNTVPVTIIGVMPASFHVGGVYRKVDYWVPLGVRLQILGFGDDWITDRTHRELTVLGRLRHGLGLEQADARLHVRAEAMAAEHPTTNTGAKLEVTSEIEGRYRERYGAVHMSCVFALLVAGLVLLISCANVANLLLARTAARTRELAIRVALGAGRGRIARQLLTESLVIATLGGGLGLIFALWFGDLLRAFLPAMPYNFFFDFTPDQNTFACAIGASLLAGLVCGAFPAWRASHAEVVPALKTDTAAEGQTLRRAGVRQLLVVGQLGVSIIVVVAGGLLLRSLQQLASIDPGFRPEKLATMIIDPGCFEYDDAQVSQFYVELTGRIERMPGVQSVSSSLGMPLLNPEFSAGPAVREGDAPPRPNEWKRIGYSIIYSKYFETVATDLVAGRDFDASERTGTPSTVIVNAELAGRLFGRWQDAIGKRFRFGDDNAPLLQVVGVARDGRYEELFEAPKPWVYLPGHIPSLHDAIFTGRTMLVRVNSTRDLASILGGVRAEVSSLDARVPQMESQVGTHNLDDALLEPRLAADLGIVLGVVALILATMGMYSVMTYTVSHRTKEIGIRMALGAQVGDVLRLVVGQAMRLVAIGVAVGVAGALVVARLLGSLLFGVSVTDPVTYLVTLGILVSASLLATVVPARRATRVDPMVALRYE
jgi:predicted permease